MLPRAVTRVGLLATFDSPTIETLQAWMSSNRLRFNQTKTQFIWFSSRQQLAKIDLGSLAIKYRHFTFSSSVRDLGVTLDQELTYVQHINLLCRSCYYQLRQLRVVSLSPAAASTLAHAFVVYRLDYCSAIYEGLPTCRFKCLDRVLRTAARLVGRIPRFGRVSGYMRDHLHLLPYPQCLPHLCVGSALHRGTSPILSPGTLLLHCYYSASYLIALFCPGGVAGPPNADCYPTAPSFLCGWSDGLEWSTGCAASDASGPLGSFYL